MFCCMRARPSRVDSEEITQEQEISNAAVDNFNTEEQPTTSQTNDHCDDNRYDDVYDHHEKSILPEESETEFSDESSNETMTDDNPATGEKKQKSNRGRKKQLIGKIQVLGLLGKSQGKGSSKGQGQMEKEVTAESLTYTKNGKSLQSVRFAEDETNIYFLPDINDSNGNCNRMSRPTSSRMRSVIPNGRTNRSKERPGSSVPRRAQSAMSPRPPSSRSLRPMTSRSQRPSRPSTSESYSRPSENKHSEKWATLSGKGIPKGRPLTSQGSRLVATSLPDRIHSAPSGGRSSHMRTVSARSVRSVPDNHSHSCGFRRVKNAKKEYFKEELGRLTTTLDKEKEKVTPPPVKEHVPYTYNTLDPYFDVRAAKFMLEQLDEEVMTPRGYQSRQTALGLCDPWVAQKMEALENKPHTKDMEAKKTPRKDEKKKEKDKDRPSKEGSTRLPKFPAVALPPDEELATKQLYYSDVPSLREELKKKYSTNAEQKIEEDYKRTKQDFYRMELDKLDEYHPLNRNNMKATYFAYLQNTPGSKKALYECVRAVENSKS